jgi:hypothetical protein
MADELTQAQSAVESVRRKISELDEAYKKAYYTTEQFKVAQNSLTSELKAAEKQLGVQQKIVSATNTVAAQTVQNGAMMQGSTRNSAMAFLQLSQAVEDAQYGIRGVQNNIPGLIMSMGGGMGLAGAVSLVVVGVSQLVEHWDDLQSAFGSGKTETEAEHMERLAKATKRTAGEEKALTAWREKGEAKKAMDAAPDARQKTKSEAASDFVGVVGGPEAERRFVEAYLKANGVKQDDQSPWAIGQRKKAAEDAPVAFQRAMGKSGTPEQQQKAQDVIGNLGLVDFTGIKGAVERNPAEAQKVKDAKAAEALSAAQKHQNEVIRKQEDRLIQEGFDEWGKELQASRERHAKEKREAEHDKSQKQRQSDRRFEATKAPFAAPEIVQQLESELAEMRAAGFTSIQAVEAVAARTRTRIKEVAPNIEPEMRSRIAGSIVSQADRALARQWGENENRLTAENSKATSDLTRQLEAIERQGIPLVLRRR